MIDHPSRLLVTVLALGCAAPGAPAAAPAPQESAEPSPEDSIRFGDPVGAYDEPFFPGATYDETIPTPDSLLGQQHGSRLAHHAEIVACFRAWADASDRITVHTYGRTHEGRELVYAVVTSAENHARLEDVRADLGKLFDPRELDDADARRIVSESPAVAWMGYSIHGDELSGADASLAVGHHLVASSDADVARLLDTVVVVIDPCMNPDGRQRIIGMVEQSAGYTPNLDYASMQRGRWPYGRGNHYLFDMNRDWMAGTQPETRGRWRVARSFHPQLFVDAHEMGALDTFLFYPQNQPLNPNLPPRLVEWQRLYAEGAGKAFDRHGWSYYTREWADAWAPFYSDAWGSLRGAVGMLYEQASTEGFPLRRASGEVLTYREAVHHQVVASMANLTTLSENREAALQSYLDNARRNVAPETEGNDRMLVVVPGANADRVDALVRILAGQGIEFSNAAAAFEGTDVEAASGAKEEAREFPAGAIVVPARQPLSPMVKTYLGFDTRMPHEDLVREREDLERKGQTRIYDLTSWSIPFALDLDAYWCDARDVERGDDRARPSEPRIDGATPAVGWLVSGAHDASVAFAARAMELGLAVHVTDIDVPLGEQRGILPPGSLLVRAVENGGEAAAVEERVLRAAREAGVRAVHRAATGLTPDETSIDAPDLGGGHFHLLARPRVALLANSPVSEDTYGHLWHLLDVELGVPFSLLDAQNLGSYDLRRYNVLVLPPGGGIQGVLEEHAETLGTWVEAGGTLIAAGSAAAALTSGNLDLSDVTLRRDALENLTPYRIATEREWASRTIEVDEALVWGDAPATGDESEEEEEEEEGSDSDDDDPYAPLEVAEDHDSWLRTFSPYGVTLRGIVDTEAWITFGAGEEMPVFFQGSRVFLSKRPVRTPVRIADEDRMRLGGLVWPEARERIAQSAWLTVERSGKGQVILFACMPAFRGYHDGTARLLANAVVLGPGMGASQPVGW